MAERGGGQRRVAGTPQSEPVGCLHNRIFNIFIVFSSLAVHYI